MNNGLYNGLDNGLHNGNYEGIYNGLHNGLQGEFINVNSLYQGLDAAYNFNYNIRDTFFKYNGTGQNLTFADGKTRGAAKFNGTNTRISFTNQVIPLGAKSICFWIKPNTHDAFDLIIDNNSISSTNFGTSIFYTAGGGATLQFFMGNGAGSNRFSLTSPTVSDGVWSFVVMSWDGTTNANKVKAYVNAGTPTTTTSNSLETVNASVNLQMGALATLLNRFDGLLQNVLFYNRELSIEDIRRLYNNGNGLSYPFTSIDNKFKGI